VSRVVVDPSVLVSAAITPRHTPPDLVVRAASDGALVLEISQMLVSELESVLGRSTLALASGAEVLVSSDRGLLEADITSPIVVDPKGVSRLLARG
jgi:predicted nucleic acid-binding protein